MLDFIVIHSNASIDSIANNLERDRDAGRITIIEIQTGVHKSNRLTVEIRGQSIDKLAPIRETFDKFANKCKMITLFQNM